MSLNNEVKTAQLTKPSFTIAGVFMVATAILCACLGLIELIAYRSSLSYPFSAHDSRPVILGLLFFIVFGVSLFAAMLSLLRKKPLLTEALMVTALVLAIATPIIYVLYPIPSETTLAAISNWTRWTNGLGSALPMIVFTIPALFLLRSNHRFLHDSNMRLVLRVFAVSGVSMFIFSLAFAYLSIEALADYRASGGSAYFPYIFVALCLLSLGVSASSLSARWLLLNGRRVGLALKLVIVALALTFPITGLSYLLLSVWSLSFIAIGLSILTFSVTEVILVRLKIGKFKEDSL